MDRDTIIRLAREAATEDGSVNRTDGKNIVIYAAKTSLFLERFAALVAAHEREACAKICVHLVEDVYGPQKQAAADCAAAIRRRS